MTPFHFGVLPTERADWLRQTIPGLAGWCSPEKAVRLADLVLHAKPMISVDLGVFGARSTLALAEGHRFAGVGYVTGVDPWSNEAALEGTNEKSNDEWWSAIDLEKIYRQAMDTMQRHAALPHWQILRLKSRDAVGHFSDGSIGVLHIDGNHSIETSCEDVRLWMPKMMPGAIVVLDDVQWPSLQEAQRQLREVYGATLEEWHSDWAVFQLKA